MNTPVELPPSVVFQTPEHQTRYTEFERAWHACSRCSISHNRSNVVNLRGQVPAKFLFIGEAPGRNEDMLAVPFIGRSGKLLDHWIITVESLLLDQKICTRRNLRQFCSWAIVNTVGCMPLTKPLSPDDPPVLRLPTLDEQAICYDRFTQLLDLCQSAAVITLGKTALNFAHAFLRIPGKHHFSGPVLSLFHPAFVLRNGGKQSQHSTEAIEFLFKFVCETNESL